MLKELAALLVAVAGESVSVVKRSAPEHALKLKKRREWELYLEFLKVLFDLADRLSALHVPVREQSHFMQSLEEMVTHQLRTLLEPALGPDSDEMEIFMTIGRAIAEGRQQYERFRFIVTEDSRTKQEYLEFFSQRIGQLIPSTDGGDGGLVRSAATLCVTAAIPAISGILAAAGHAEVDPSPTTSSPAATEPATTTGGRGGEEIKLVSVVSSMQGDEIETRWGLHPRFRQDLSQPQVEELTRYMNRVTQILGRRYATVAVSGEWTAENRVGHA